MSLIAEHPLWYLNRGSGMVLTVVLTLSVALGVLATARSGSAAWPRYATQALHRSVSLMAAVLLAVHAGAAVVDTYVSGFVRITPVDVVVPFLSTYQPLWLGVGTLACDLVVAVGVTSVVRHRLSHRTWRVVHLLSYLGWLLGLVHGWMIGSDVRTAWGLAVLVGCLGAVASATVVRVGTYRQERLLDRSDGAGTGR